MERRRMNVLSALAIAGAIALPLACSDSGSPSAPNQDKATNGPSKVVVKLTDAPFSTDQVKSVDIFVVRAEGRVAATDDNDANENLDNGANAGWQTLAEPNASFDLLTLQHGTSVTLGETPIPPGTYNGLRLIIDPSQSSVTLKDGTVLTGNSKPGVSFPSANKSGIKIVPSQPVTIVDGETTTLLVDFDVSQSFVMRGNSIEKNGLLFKPVIKATIVADTVGSDTTSTDTLKATFRFSNALDTTLTVRVDTTALVGGSNLAFGASSSCSSVNAATPLLSTVFSGTTTALTGFAPVFSPGGNYTLLAYPDSGGIHFATLANAFTPTSGQSGLRVFNASGDSTGIDVFVTAAGDSLGTATVSNALQGVASAFVSVPAGSSQVRLTSTGSSTVLLDLGAQSFTAGKNATLVVAPAKSDSTPVRAFLVPSC
jgi:hypothetical protein